MKKLKYLEKINKMEGKKGWDEQEREKKGRD